MNREQSAMLRATPGRILQEEFLDDFHISQAELAKRTGIPRSAVNEIIHGKRSISTETAFALGFFFNMDPHFWINLQTQYDMRRVQFEKAAAIRARVTPLSPA
jgi:addiction module HigA family antidote